jgi:hypothetical protein
MNMRRLPDGYGGRPEYFVNHARDVRRPPKGLMLRSTLEASSSPRAAIEANKMMRVKFPAVRRFTTRATCFLGACMHVPDFLDLSGAWQYLAVVSTAPFLSSLYG